jgi:hypothetical protein
MAKLLRFGLLTVDQLENSPSRKDGVNVKQEARVYREVYSAMVETSKRFKK